MKKKDEGQGKGLLKGFASKLKNPFKKKEANIEIIEDEDYIDDEYEDLQDDEELIASDEDQDAPPNIEDLVNDEEEDYHVSESESQGLEQTLPNRNFSVEDLDNVEIEEEADFDNDEQTNPELYQEMKGPPKEGNHIHNILSRGRDSFKELLSKKKIESSAKKRKETGVPSRLTSITSDFSFDHVVEVMFSPEKRPFWHRLFIMCLLLTLCYQTGKHISAFLSQKAESFASSGLGGAGNIQPQGAPASNANIMKIAEANLFNAKQTDAPTEKTPEKKPVIANINCREATRVTALPIILLNTVVLQDTVKSTASIQIRGQQDALSLREGEKLNDMAEVGKINRLSVVLKNLKSGQCELIKNNEDQPPSTGTAIKVLSPEQGRKAIAATKNEGIKNEGNKFNIKKNVREQMLSNISEVLTQARAVQIKNPDGTFSFKMTEIVPGSIYAQLGIQNDDIITSIDGKKISNLNEVMSMFGRIKNIDNLSISVQRNGVETNMDYNFED